MYVATTVVSGVAGKRCVSGIYNKPNSGKILLLDKIVCAHSASSAPQEGFDLRYDVKTHGAKRDVVRPKLLGGANSSAAELWEGTCLAASLPPSANVIYEMWTGGKFVDGHYDFKTPFQIPPGYYICICSSHDASYQVATFEFSEVAI